MDWVWEIYRPYIRRQFVRRGVEDPTEAACQAAFIESLAGSSATVLVQEPWRGTVRFKALARLDREEMFALMDDPSNYLFARFGGGKFKVNFHEGWNFVATKNFKPEGEPLWQDLPAIDL